MFDITFIQKQTAEAHGAPLNPFTHARARRGNRRYEFELMDYIFVNYSTSNWNARYVFLLRTRVMFTYLQFHMRIYLRVCKYIMILYAYSGLEICTVVNRLIKFPGFITNYANIKWRCECVAADVCTRRNYRLVRFCKLWFLLGARSFLPLRSCRARPWRWQFFIRSYFALA